MWDLLNTISSPLSNDPATDCYIRWQLLSAIKQPLDAKLEQMLVKIYFDVPAPGIRPGITSESRRALDLLTRKGKESDALNINQTHSKMLKEFEDANYSNIQFRNTLSQRLPPSVVGMQAGISDAITRASSGIDAGALVKNIRGQLHQVAAGADLQELSILKAEFNKVLVKLGEQQVASVLKPEVDGTREPLRAALITGHGTRRP